MKRRRILLLPGIFNHLTYQGIVDYAHAANWSVELQYVLYRKIPPDWDGDGIIVYNNGSKEIEAFLADTDLPVVDLGHSFMDRSVPRVWKDDAAVGGMAADYFHARGFHHYAFHEYFKAPKRVPSNHNRYVSFKKTVVSSGHEFHELDGTPLVEKLRSLPRPLALLAANDNYALRTLDICLSAGLRIPEEVAVLGIDDNPDLCDLAQTPLSSIDSSCREVGYRAAELLDRLMNGEPPPTDPILIPPKAVTTRQSTEILAVPHLPTATALNNLRRHYENQLLDLNEVARHAGISRRNLELAFKKHLGYTMFDYLEWLRTEAAISLLKDSGDPGYEIAEACGFSNVDHLSRVFKKHYGKSLRQMRNHLRPSE